MPRSRALSQREAAHRALRAEIGRRLREGYDLTQPLPDHLRELMDRIAQAERDTTQRTGAALPALSRAGDRARDPAPLIAELQAAGITSLRELAGALNDRGIAAPRGGKWNAEQVRTLLATFP